jgi:toxin ParE1/3/4
LQGIYENISNALLEPINAAKQVNRIMDAVDSLDHMPLRCRLHTNDPWRTKGLRVLSVDNYLVFYLPVESRSIVTIIRIMYKGRDVDKNLNKPEECP